MRLDAIAIGKNPPEDVNVVVEVAIGGEPIKYEMDKEAGTLVVDRFLYTPMRYPGNYGSFRTPCPRRRPDRRAGGEYAADRARRGDQCPTCRGAEDGRRRRRGREDLAVPSRS